MALPLDAWRLSLIAAVPFGLAAAFMAGSPATAARAQLVHCGAETCLRLSGHRSHAGVAVRVAGHELAVTGDRAWHATVPLSTARDWPHASGGTIALTLADASTGLETPDAAAAPPGALGRRVELVSLQVHAH